MENFAGAFKNRTKKFAADIIKYTKGFHKNEESYYYKKTIDTLSYFCSI